jgi:hypothetical protein
VDRNISYGQMLRSGDTVCFHSSWLDFLQIMDGYPRDVSGVVTDIC